LARFGDLPLQGQSASACDGGAVCRTGIARYAQAEIDRCHRRADGVAHITTALSAHERAVDRPAVGLTKLKVVVECGSGARLGLPVDDVQLCTFAGTRETAEALPLNWSAGPVQRAAVYACHAWSGDVQLEGKADDVIAIGAPLHDEVRRNPWNRVPIERVVASQRHRAAAGGTLTGGAAGAFYREGFDRAFALRATARGERSARGCLECLNLPGEANAPRCSAPEQIEHDRVVGANGVAGRTYFGIHDGLRARCCLECLPGELPFEHPHDADAVDDAPRRRDRNRRLPVEHDRLVAPQPPIAGNGAHNRRWVVPLHLRGCTQRTGAGELPRTVISIECADAEAVFALRNRTGRSKLRANCGIVDQ
jgi:hypothetical protein